MYSANSKACEILILRNAFSLRSEIGVNLCEDVPLM